MAQGADMFAHNWAEVVGIPIEEYPANWKEFGKSAGAIRNQQMLKEGKPNLVIAFPGGRGTEHMIEISKKAKVKVEQVR